MALECAGTRGKIKDEGLIVCYDESTMWYGLLGLILGIVAGVFTNFTIPPVFARYTAVGLVAIVDSVVGAIRADLQKKYHPAIFVSGLLTNMVVAGAVTFLGDRLGLDLYLAVLVAFMIRILTNIGVIRYSYIERFIGKKAVEEKLEQES